MPNLTCKDIITEFEHAFPSSLALDYDNVGLLVGATQKNVENVFLCLDVTYDNILSAIDCNSDLIVSHHPLIFKPIKKILETDSVGKIITKLVEKKISLFTLHTNLDVAQHGLNEILAKKIGFKNIKKYDSFMGKIGEIQEKIYLKDFAKLINKILNCKALRYVGKDTDLVKKVAVCAGSGACFIEEVNLLGADLYLTSDIKHHDAQKALELGLNLIDAGHFETENIFCDFMFDFLSKRFSQIKIIKSSANGFFKSIV